MSLTVDRRSRPVDRTVSWVLYAVQLLASLVLALLAVTSVFMTDSCGSSDADAAVCNVAYFGATLVGYWAALLVLVVVVPVAIALRTRAGRPSWWCPVAGIAVTAALTALFVALMTR